MARSVRWRCKYKVKLHIDTSVQPAAQPHHLIPFHVQKKVEDKLVELENIDIIENIEGPTPWISPIVTPPKPGNPDEIQQWVDMRGPNTAIKHEWHHQVMLDELSHYITTFSKHVGLRRY